MDEGTLLDDIIRSADSYHLYPTQARSMRDKQKYTLDALFMGSNEPRFEVKMNIYRGCEQIKRGNSYQCEVVEIP